MSKTRSAYRPTTVVVRTVLSVVAAAGVCLGPSLARGGAIDDARKLLDAKQYDKVDAVLAKQLEQASPPAEALRISLAAAEARGRIITAQKRITALLKATAQADLDLVYRGAMISEQAGERRLALSRYLIYARKQTDKPERTRHALEYLVTQGKFPGEYKKYVKIFGRSTRTWDMGLALVKRLVVDRETTMALDLGAFMMETFTPSPRQAYVFGQYLVHVSERGYLGSEPRKRYIVPLQIMARRRPSTYDQVVRMCSFAGRYLSAQEAADALLAIHAAAGGAVDTRCLMLLDRLRYAREGSNPLALSRRVYDTLEPLYRASDSPGAYAAFIDQICRYRDAFVTNRDSVFDAKTLSDMLAAAAKKGAAAQISLALDRLCTRDEALRTALARKHAALVAPDRATWVIGRISGNKDEQARQTAAAKPFVQAFVKGRDARGSVLARMALMAWYDRISDKASLQAAAREYMAAFPGNFSWQEIWNRVWNSSLLSVAEKTALLTEQFTRSGQCGPMDQIITQRIARDGNMRKDPDVKAMIRAYSKRPKGSDAVMRLAVWVQDASRRRKGSPDKMLAEALGAYGKPVPPSQADATNVTEIALVDAVAALVAGWNNPAQLAARGKLLDRLTPGPMMARLFGRLDRANPHDLVARIAPKLKGADPATMKIWWALSFARNPKGDTASVFAPYYAKMGWDNAARYLLGQIGSWHQRSWRWSGWGRGVWTREPFMDEMEKLAAMEGFVLRDPWVRQEIRNAVLRRSSRKGRAEVMPSEAVADALWASYLAGAKAAGRHDADAEAGIFAVYRMAGREAASAWLDDYVKVLAARSVGEQVATTARMMRSVGAQRVMIEKGKGAYLRLFAVAAAAYERMQDDQWHSVGVQEEIRTAAGMLANNVPWRTALKNEAALLAVGQKLADTFDARLLAGARWAGGHSPVPSLCDRAVAAAAPKRDWPAAIAATRRLAESIGAGGSADRYRTEITAVAGTLEKAGANEILYAFLRQIEQGARLSSAMRKDVAMLRARAAKDIAGLIIVSPNAPTYPLHLAAQTLLLGDEAQAWELSRSHAGLFGKSWQELDPDFVNWYVRQLYKQKLYANVLSLARSILEKESSLDAEVAASIHLTVGDVRRGQANNDAALEIYKTLQASDRYKNTQAATQARYRQVMLMISTGAYGEAEDTLAHMIESPSIDEQAEAYYLLARLADEQKEYGQADKYLAKVRARVPDHIEAAFLEGELRAKAPSMLARGEILEIGVVAMETVAVPGRELVFRLQDSNLAIAKGSTTIPVTVETSTGKDRETVELVLSGTGKNLFKGSIVAALGKIAPADNTLQLRGEDVVTYRIADEFQKSHDISYRPKTLTVKADGELSASAGRILTAKEAEQREIERRLAAARGEEPPAWAREKRKSVRPGSPVYVRVKDLDRDVSAEPDIVVISVKTTGGDAIDTVELTETGPNTGVFMGQIPTSLPLPKGLASDTFEGKSPAWLINSTVNKVWSSVDDGGKDKWVEADTMTSHAVKSVSLELPDATKIGSLALSGRLSGTEQTPLAVYPLVGQQQGLRLELFADDKLTKPTAERTVGSTSLRVGDLGKGNVAARLSGVIVPPYSGQYTFRADVRSARAKLHVGGRLLVDQWPAKGDGKSASGKMNLHAGREYPFALAFAHSAGNPRAGECHVTWESKTIGRQGIPLQAIYPGPMASRMDDLRHWRGSVSATADHPLATFAAIRAGVKIDKDTAPPHVKATCVSPGRDEVGILAGVFSLPAERMLAMKLTAVGVGAESRAYLLIDGRRELGGKLSDLADKTKTVFLRKGAHRMELVYRSAGPAEGGARIAVHTGDAEGTFSAMPWQWFSADHTPDLADAVLPNGLIALQGDTFTATLRKPIRLRSVRWHFQEYMGKDVAVKKIGVTDAGGNRVIPVEKDFTTSLTNDVLEIAPGDRISMVYVDEKNLQGESSARRAGLGLGRSASLSVGFTDGEIALAHEEKRTDADGNERMELFTARRCSAGDVLTVIVRDDDIDQTPKRDKIDVIVTTSSGQKADLAILERQSLDRSGKPHDVCHTGEFIAKIKLLSAADKAAPGTKPATRPAGKGTKAEDVVATLAVVPGDDIVVRYLDEENNDGVPMDRMSRLTEGGAGLGGWTVLRTRTRLVEDTSSGGVLLRDDLRRISRDPELKVYREEVLHLSPRVKANEDDAEPTVDRGLDAAGLPICSVRGQMQFSLLYPKMARNMGSTVTIAAVAESEVKAAKAAKRPLRGARVAMDLPDEEDLDAGRFHGALNLQIGVPGDKLAIDVAAAAAAGQPVVKTIIVRGDDVVQLRFKDPDTGKTSVQRVRLLADGRMEVLERTLRARKLNIHLGERFHVRVADPDKDTTDKRDTVTVSAKCSSGSAAELKLTETLVHSGVFTASLEPRWIKNRAADAAARKAAIALAAKIAADKVATKAASAKAAAKAASAKTAADKAAAAAAAAKAAAGKAAAKSAAAKTAADEAAAKAAETNAPADKAAADKAKSRAAAAKAAAKTAANKAASAKAAAKKTAAVSAAEQKNAAAKAAAAKAAAAKQAPYVAKTPPPMLYADFGDTVTFTYSDDKPVTTREPLVVALEGSIVHGSDGAVSLFSKKYKDPEMAVKVSFLTAEAMFNMGKALRTGPRKALANEYIARGKAILQQALHDYPNTTLVAQGEFLVATLAQELGNYSEARGKYSEVVRRWPKSPYAPKALFASAQCYEAEKNYELAINEYVRVTYLFPDSPEVVRATLRIGNHYLRQARTATQAKKPVEAAEAYAVAGRILEKFHENHPKHARAAAALFLSGECYRLCARYPEAITVFTRVAKTCRDDKVIRAEAMYWKGVCAREIKDYVMAYKTLKRLTWDYPESKQAANARKLIGGDEFEYLRPAEEEDQ